MLVRFLGSCLLKKVARHHKGFLVLPQIVRLSTMSAVKRSYNDIAKSEEDKRCYRGLELSNGLKVLLISDPTTDKSSAALDVHIGHMSDPVHLPGLAHFCEHMLFLGTEKFPDENEYSKFLSQHGGSFNAFTSSDHTNYYFDVSPDNLGGALDRFSQFFLTPLFTESATDREVNAVNSEHEKNIPNDTWRINQIEKATADVKHDFSKFGTGNKETLDVLPKEQGVSVRDSLLEFHSTWYSSNIMGLAVLGREDLDILQEMVVERFTGVVDKSVMVPEWKTAPFLDDQCGTVTYIVPVKDIRNLNITWGIPDLTDHYQSCPGSYLGHLIGHEGPGSLLSELKSRGWVNTLVGGQKSGSKGFGFFVVNVDLTEEGINHVDDIVQLVFQYLAMLRSKGPQQWVFEECQDLNAMQFRFKDKERPQSYTCGLSGHLHDFPVPEVLTGGYILASWRPDLITEVLDQLTPHRVRVAVIAQQYAEKCDVTEKWYGAKYKCEKIPKEKLDNWDNCGMHEKLRLPDKNDFIPTDFSLTARDWCTIPHPTILHQDSLGTLWFKQDNEFLLPKNCINIELKSPIAYSDPHHANLTYMFAMLFKDELNEYVYAAELAGLGYSLANTKSGVTLAVKGYSDKQGVLLDKIMDKLTSFSVDTNRFNILKEAYTRGLKNFQAEQPHQHAVYYNSVVLSERVWHKEELLGALPDLTVQAVEDFIPRLLCSIHVECMVYGNCTDTLALSLYTRVVDKLKTDCRSKPLLPSQLIKEREVELRDLSSLYTTTNSVHKSSCIENYYQCGLQNTRQNMLLELFSQIINESCYNQLRTKEQLGYIVFSGVRRSNGAQGLRVIVQSDRNPEYLDKRIEHFLHSLDETLAVMDENEFNQHVEALATKRLEKPKKLSVRNGRYWSEILSQHYNFDRDQIEVDSLRSLTKDDIISFYREHIASTDSRKKLSCHVLSTCEGGAGHPDTPAMVNGNAEVDTSSEEHDASLVNGETEETSLAPPRIVTDITSFKSSLPLFPLAQPYVQPDLLKRPSKP